MFHLPYPEFLILETIVKIVVALIFANLIFFTILSLFGLKRPKRNYEIVADEKKFIFLVPAHNEEEVIRPTIESLLSQNYNRDLYDIVIIADNCTDKTAAIVQEYEEQGVILFENNSKPDEPRGKPHAIAKFVDTNQWLKYDFVAFIDADNIVHKDYLKEMNSQSVANPELTVIQGYLGIKNVFSSLVATGYAAVYFITNRAVQFANYRLGWNSAIGGTGFILQTEYLEKNGWNPKSYTEDFELQVELSIAGKSSGWNHFAVVYDEKPNSVIASHHQRTRWAQGHWYVAFTTTAKQLVSLTKSKSLKELLSKVETLFYSYSMMRPIAFLIILFLVLIDVRLVVYIPNLFSLLFFWLGIEGLNFLVIPTVYFLQEASEYFNTKENIFYKIIFFVRLVIAFIFNSITYMVAQVVGFCTWFFPQNKWRKTAHSAVIDHI